MLLATELKTKAEQNSANIELQIPANLFWFKGHFPQQPLLPGVTQLHWVMHYGKTLLGLTADLQTVDVLKFQNPILPNDNVLLTLTWNNETNKLHFRYTIMTKTIDNQTTEKLASSGKLSLCQ